MFMTDTLEASVGSFVESLKGNDAAFRVVVGQGRLLTLKQKIATEKASALIAVGDPSIADFRVLPNPRLIRVLGLRPASPTCPSPPQMTKRSLSKSMSLTI